MIKIKMNITLIKKKYKYEIFYKILGKDNCD